MRVHVSDVKAPDQYYIHEELKSRLNSGNVLYFLIPEFCCLPLSSTATDTDTLHFHETTVTSTKHFQRYKKRDYHYPTNKT